MNKLSIMITMIISSLIIGFCILGGFYILGQSLHPTTNAVSTNDVIADNAVMNKSEVADYLKLSTQDVDTIIQKDLELKRTIGSGISDTYQFLPYFKTTTGQMIFLKEEVNQWLTYKTQHAVNK